MSAAQTQDISDLELIDRGLIPGSEWRVFVGPEQSCIDGFLKVNVIQPDGMIGFTLYTPGVTNAGIRWLTHRLDTRQFLANISNEHFVRI